MIDAECLHVSFIVRRTNEGIGLTYEEVKELCQRAGYELESSIAITHIYDEEDKG
jgi:hypothetical protein